LLWLLLPRRMGFVAPGAVTVAKIMHARIPHGANARGNQVLLDTPLDFERHEGEDMRDEK